MDTPKTRIVAHVAYQLEEMNGGFQLYKIVLNDKKEMVSRNAVSSPDAWEQTISLLEAELSRQFQ